MDNNLPAGNAGSAPAETGSTEAVSYGGGFTPAELKQMAEWAVADGNLSQQQADAMLKGDSGSNTAPPSNDQPAPATELYGLPPLDLNSPEAMAEHQAFTDVPPEGKPYDFHMPFAGVDGQFVGEMQTLCSDLKLPAFVARYASNLYNKANDALHAGTLTDADIEIAHSKAQYKLREMWPSPGEYEAKVRAAQSVINHLPPEKQARVKEILTVTGLGNDVLLISQLAALAQHRAAAAGRK